MNWYNDLLKNTTAPSNAVRLQEVVADVDVTELVASISVPTLVLHALDDGTIPFEQGRLLASLIPGARFVPQERNNHILLEDEPPWSQLLREIDQFLV